MKIIVPISSFLLALTVYFLAGIQCGIHTIIVYLFSIDAVNHEWKSELVGINSGLSFWTILIALISVALATVSIYHKFCHRIIGVILLVISVLTILLSLLLRFM